MSKKVKNFFLLIQYDANIIQFRVRQNVWLIFLCRFETSNGISQEENGQLVNPGQENESIAVRGKFSYTGHDGVTYVVTYTADDSGFHPEGAHLPHSK